MYNKFIAAPEPGWYHALHKAPRFDEIAVSSDGHMSDNYLAFAAAWQAKDKDRLLTLVEHAQPAGKLYAALCLFNIDSGLAQDAFTRLAESNQEVQTCHACRRRTDSVERIAKSYLRGSMPIILPTPNNIAAKVNRFCLEGIELCEAGKYQEALLAINKALSLHARSPQALKARAEVYYKMGQAKLARADLKLASQATFADKNFGMDKDGKPIGADSIFGPRLQWK